MIYIYIYIYIHIHIHIHIYIYTYREREVPFAISCSPEALADLGLPQLVDVLQA